MALLNRTLFAQVRSLLGGKMEYMLSGAAALNPDTGRFFTGIGIPVMEGYGLTETTAPCTGIRPDQVVAGSVGEPMPGTTIRVDDHGNIAVKGMGVFAGYFGSDAPATDPDGFFATGDMGHLDSFGRLTVTGRSKDVLVTAGGKNIAPGRWQSEVEAHPLVQHALVVGEGRAYAGAVIVVDRDAVRERFGKILEAAAPAAPGIKLMDKALRDAIAAVVAAANKGVSTAEAVRRFVLVDADVSEPTGLTTPTRKVRRGPFTEAFKTWDKDVFG